MKQWSKSLVVVSGLACAVSASPTSAQAAAPQRSVGAGFVLGEPTGLSLKIWVERERAIDVGVAFSLNEYFLIYSDYLFHFPGMFRGVNMGGHTLLPYVGPGVMMAFDASDQDPARFFRDHDSNFALAFRVPVGMEWVPPRAPLGVFLEIVPGVGFLPETFAFVGAGIGVRYYF